MTQHPFLVADVGGTNTRLALSDGDILREPSVRRLRNDDFATFQAALASYMDDIDATPSAVAIAIAGPVSEGAGQLTNRDWRMSEKGLCGDTGARRARIINDLHAQAMGLPAGADHSLEAVRSGHDAPDAARLVVNVGTGLNIATIWRGHGGPFVAPAEAGHITLPLRGAQQRDLGRYLEDRFGFASAEEVLSGRGMATLHHWRTGETIPPADVTSAALRSQGAARETATTFARLLGQYAGDLALVQLAFGGVYMVGGVARHVFAVPGTRKAYAAGFTDKGRFGDFLDPIPSNLVTDDYAPLRGLARVLATGQ